MSAQPANPNLPPDHVTIYIDDVELAAPKGSMIIHAADKAGIPIPRFCYHEKLPIAANCRMCLVDTEVGGRSAPKPSPACATPVMDGMKVFTRNDKALKAQRNVMEFLLINHPLDCPICDQGGECELQDLSLGYGRSVSRFSERKRVVPDEDLGPLVATEMTRCIQCTRCIRFTAEVAGTYELGGMQRGENLQIGTYDGKPLTTELSGNVIDVCPVGALTNKVFRFRARPWELIARESLGYHDALGSNLFLHLRRGEVLRSVPRENEAVNECWLSDRDRYSHQGLASEDRASTPLLRVANNGDDADWRDASWDEALARATEILQQQDIDDLGILVHPATSNEEGALLARLAAGLHCGNLDHRIGQRDLSDGAHAERFAAPVAEIELADAIVMIGSHLRHEVPLLHQRVRKAWKAGAKIHVINPVDFEFAFDIASKAIVPPSQMAAMLGNELLAAALKDAKHLLVLVGGIAENGEYAAQIRASVTAFAERHQARVCRIPQGANAVGLTDVGVLPKAHGDAQTMLRQPRKAYVLYGIEPGLDFADQALALKALSAAKVIAFSHYACASTRAVADVILPIGALPEIEASLTNLDGRVQTTVAGGKLPGEARPGWRVLRALGARLGIAGFDFTELTEVRELLQVPRDIRQIPVPAVEPETPAHDGFEIACSAAIYRVDAVTRRAAALQSHPLTTGPRVTLHPDDAAAHGIQSGVMVKLSNAHGAATLPAVLSDRVARGAVWLESGYPATAALSAGRVKVVAA